MAKKLKHPHHQSLITLPWHRGKLFRKPWKVMSHHPCTWYNPRFSKDSGHNNSPHLQTSFAVDFVLQYLTSLLLNSHCISSLKKHVPSSSYPVLYSFILLFVNLTPFVSTARSWGPYLACDSTIGKAVFLCNMPRKQSCNCFYLQRNEGRTEIRSYMT